MIYQHTNALHLSTNIKRLLRAQNKSTIEKMTHCLLLYNLATTLLSGKIFIGSTHLKILSDRNSASMSKISINGYVKVLLLQS